MQPKALTNCITCVKSLLFVRSASGALQDPTKHVFTFGGGGAKVGDKQDRTPVWMHNCRSEPKRPNGRCNSACKLQHRPRPPPCFPTQMSAARSLPSRLATATRGRTLTGPPSGSLNASAAGGLQVVVHTGTHSLYLPVLVRSDMARVRPHAVGVI